MASAEPFDRRRPLESSRFGHTVVYQGEVFRHSGFTRVVHWAVALSFVLALLSGFALFTPWLYKWLSLPFGGGPLARLLHPWFGLAFVIVMLVQVRAWWDSMRWEENDWRWLRRLRAYITHEEKVEPDYVGKFNAGQKIWFWTMAVSGLIFLITGILLWFPETFSRTAAWISYFFHDLAGLIMLGGFLVHIYEGTGGLPGTFRSMTRGTVSDEWAWTHHPGWYRQVTGRDPATARAAASRPPIGRID